MLSYVPALLEGIETASRILWLSAATCLGAPGCLIG